LGPWRFIDLHQGTQNGEEQDLTKSCSLMGLFCAYLMTIRVLLNGSASKALSKMQIF
jgi:hypothetical protein